METQTLFPHLEFGLKMQILLVSSVHICGAGCSVRLILVTKKWRWIKGCEGFRKVKQRVISNNQCTKNKLNLL